MSFIDIKEYIKTQMDKNNISKKDIKSFSIFISLIIFFGLISYFFNISINTISYIFIFLSILLLTYILLFFSGYIVFKSLFLVGAEISLLLFISQSYCSISHNLQTEKATNAIKFLISFGLIFIAFLFLKNLWDSFKKIKENISAKEKNKFEYWIFISMLAFMISYFIYQLILAFTPIIKDICFLN